MNIYDKYFDFRLATSDDIDPIMKFIGDEWKKDHILSKNRKLFMWQYGNEEYDDYDTINVFLMTDKKNNIVGINGFVQYSNDPLLRYVSSALTAVKADVGVPMCGIELIKRFKEQIPANAYYSSGTREKTMIPVGKKVFNYTVGIMQQFYIVNPTISDFKIARINSRTDESTYDNGIGILEPADMKLISEKYDFSSKYYNQGYKSREYIQKRFFKHPVYVYKAYGIKKNSGDKYVGVLFGREIDVGDTRIFRIVDYIGDIKCLGEIGDALHRILLENNYEYIDLLAGSIEYDILKRSGFRLLKQNDENIIPMYFEPFVRENKFIWYQKSNPDIVIFKADGDQDRPNVM